MRTLILLAASALAIPSPANTTKVEVVQAALQYHFDRTQPFLKGAAVVSPITRTLPSDERLPVRDLVKDAAIAEQLEAHTAAEILSLPIPATSSYLVGAFPNKGASADWRSAAETYPSANVAFEVFTPLFTSDGSYAVVRLDGTVLRDANAGLRSSMCYGMRRTEPRGWVFDNFVAPCANKRVAPE